MKGTKMNRETTREFRTAANDIAQIGYEEYRIRMIKNIILMVIGFIIGFALSGIMDDYIIFVRVLFGLMFAGVPYTWKIMPFYALGLISFIIKFFCCVLIGWIVAPIVLIFNLLKMRSYRNMMVEA